MRGSNNIDNTPITEYIDEALFANDPELVKTKLSLGGNPNVCKDGRNPLMHAIRRNYRSVVDLARIFLQSGLININQRDRKDNTALILASKHLSGNKCNDVILLLAQVEDIDIAATNAKHETAAYCLVERSQETALKSLIDIHKLKYPGVVAAAQKDNVAATDTNVDDDHFKCPLRLAIDKGNDNCVQYLLDSTIIDINRLVGGEDVFETTQIRLKEMSDKISKYIAITKSKRIFKKKMSKEAQNLGPVQSLFSGISELMLKLIAHRGLNPNQFGSDGLTPLNRAVQDLNLDVVQALVQREDLNPNLCQNDDDMPPLYRAVFLKEADFVTALLRSPDIDPNIKYANCTCLHRAHVFGLNFIAKQLVSHVDINVHIPGPNGLTYAQLVKDKDILQLIVEKGLY